MPAKRAQHNLTADRACQCHVSAASSVSATFPPALADGGNTGVASERLNGVAQVGKD